MTKHVTGKSCQRSASCWERWHPEVILSPPKHLVFSSALSMRKDHNQEDSVGWVYWPSEQDLGGRLFLSLGLNFALRESSVWHFCRGKLAE